MPDSLTKPGCAPTMPAYRPSADPGTEPPQASPPVVPAPRKAQTMARDNPRFPDDPRPRRPEPDDQSAGDSETLAEKIRRYRQPDEPAPRSPDRESRERRD